MHHIIFSQSTDIIRLEYTHIPENSNGITTSRYRVLANFPFSLGPEDYLITGAEYNFIDIGVTRTFPFEFEELEQLHIIDFNIGYVTRWNENWRFIGVITPRLASNFVNGVEGGDFRFNATGVFLKTKNDTDKPFRLFLGISFNSASGLPFPLPLVSYRKRFHENWSFNIGVPKLNLEYHLTDKLSLELGALLDGYYVNAQNDILLPDDTIGSNISLSAVLGSLGFRYRIKDEVQFYGFFGHTLIQSGLLRDDKRKKVFVLNEDQNIYFRVGFRVGIF